TNTTNTTNTTKLNNIISVMMLRNNKKYLLENSENIWKFPEFLRELNELNGKNNRDFLKKIIHEKFTIDISVRPIFWKEQCYEFARCQIQSGEKNFLLDIEKNNEYKFFTISDIIELYENKKFTYYSQEFYKKIIKMRT
ncbi:TPA: hypothetical protein EYG84_02255, partial [Candidatus Gracilibacteria bacterium]|nr:hypothetical protein [Candidatus Gracilibacteria bacterium]